MLKLIVNKLINVEVNFISRVVQAIHVKSSSSSSSPQTMESTNGPRQWGPGAGGPKRSPDSRSVQNTPVQTKKGRSQERETKEEDMPPGDLEEALTASIANDIERTIKDIVE